MENGISMNREEGEGEEDEDDEDEEAHDRNPLIRVGTSILHPIPPPPPSDG